MSSSVVETREALATRVEVSGDTLSVELADGRTIAAPLALVSTTGARLGGGAGVVATARRRAGHPLAGDRRGHQHRQFARGPAVRRKSIFVQEVVGGPGQAESQPPETISRIEASRREPPH